MSQDAAVVSALASTRPSADSPVAKRLKTSSSDTPATPAQSSRISGAVVPKSASSSFASPKAWVPDPAMAAGAKAPPSVLSGRLPPFATGVTPAKGKGKGKGKGTANIPPIAVLPKSAAHLLGLAVLANPAVKAVAKSSSRTKCSAVPKKSLGARRTVFISKACGQKLTPKAGHMSCLKAKASAPARKFDQELLNRMPVERQTCISLLPWLGKKLDRSVINKDSLPEIDDFAQIYCERKGTYEAFFGTPSWDSRLLRLIPAGQWKNSPLKERLGEQIEKLAAASKVDVENEDITKNVAYWVQVCQKKAINMAYELLTLRLTQLNHASSEALEGMDADEMLEMLIGDCEVEEEEEEEEEDVDGEEVSKEGKVEENEVAGSEEAKKGEVPSVAVSTTTA
eukprot:GEMP01027724.1.p1 GENE.GEMP01027724.1~~GEMP01027724.1.p1  ORF type:complete len:397 (+),score=120.49 GEMP01027724.1:483-1673(+)